MILVESNLGNEAHHHRNYLKGIKLRNYLVMHEDRGRVGFRTTHALKSSMAMSTNEMIRRGQIRFHRNMVVCNKKSSVDGIRKKVVGQLRSFMRTVVPPGKPYQQAKVYYHGKFGPNRDDLVMALMINIEAEQLFAADMDGKYSNYKR